MTLLPDDVYNRQLVENVHPSGWVNPTVSGKYNLAVLGAGPAGLVSAVGAAALGAKVAIVERQLLGGDCLNFGCVPSKGLLRAARAARESAEASGFGIRCEGAGIRVDFATAAERMRRIRSRISEHDSARRLASLGIDVFLGNARFVGPDALEVREQRLTFSKAVIATGARAAEPPVPGLREAGYFTNETIFSLTEAPRRLATIGGGPIGCELSQAFRRFGSEVSIISRGQALLPREDAETSALLRGVFEREGISLFLGAQLERVEQEPGAKVLVLRRNGARVEVRCDAILVAVGRAPNLEGLGLQDAGVAFDQKGVWVDARLRTSNRRIYAAGDICSPYKFTHIADAMARVVIQNALFFGRKRASALVIPWCTYTDPEVAHVGINEAQARERPAEVATYRSDLAEVDRALLDGETDGFAKIHARKKNGQILGATLVARHAGEMISEVVLAMGQRLGLKAMVNTIHPYPTQAEVLKRAAEAQQRSRLTPRVQPWLRRYFGWRR
jgi:pyruvate/2-oxoglutarate dehydrogenase complex dihydrolipoamide dehydrogenase (E3) component